MIANLVPHSRYRPVDRVEMESIFSRVYDSQYTTEPDPIQSHRVAVIFMMLAMGALMDLERPPYSYDANYYYQLARASLAVDSVFEEQSIPAIQALARLPPIPIRNPSMLTGFR